MTERITTAALAASLMAGAGSCTDASQLEPIRTGLEDAAASSPRPDAFSFAADAGPEPVQPIGTQAWRIGSGPDSGTFDEVALAPNGDVVVIGGLGEETILSGGEPLEIDETGYGLYRFSGAADELLCAHLGDYLDVAVDGDGYVVALEREAVVRLTPACEQAWRVELPESLVTGAVAVSEDGDIAAGGSYLATPDWRELRELYLAHVSRGGEIQWSQRSGDDDREGSFISANRDFFSVAFTPAGDIAVGSSYTTRVEFGGLLLERESPHMDEMWDREGFVALIAPDGDGRWIRHVDGEDGARVVDVAARADGSIVAAASRKASAEREDYAHLMRTYDEGGDVIREVIADTMRGKIFEMALTGDGGAVLAGHFGRGSVWGTTMFLKHFAADGELTGEHFVEDYISAGYRAVAILGDRLVAAGGFREDSNEGGRLDAFDLEND